jgi:hypothetical protein
MNDNTPLTLEEVNQMPMSALSFNDFAQLSDKGFHFRNYSEEQLTMRVPSAEVERIRELLPSHKEFRKYWVWVRAGLEPAKALRKVRVDRAKAKRSRLDKVQVIYVRRAA